MHAYREGRQANALWLTYSCAQRECALTVAAVVHLRCAVRAQRVLNCSLLPRQNGSMDEALQGLLQAEQLAAEEQQLWTEEDTAELEQGKT